MIDPRLTFKGYGVGTGAFGVAEGASSEGEGERFGLSGSGSIGHAFLQIPARQWVSTNAPRSRTERVRWSNFTTSNTSAFPAFKAPNACCRAGRCNVLALTPTSTSMATRASS
jgi:hypothetical protein